ncbi:acyltransferase [Stutzerimonas nitrititolerans]|uniref:acyltransferase n=1 Tax=Stutzerimonas nitrititolerans TaxID=2482751 RepID=UPI0028A93AB0|nr:acyltransferase [Stutzerimonas nitrititolerans]
MLGMIALSHELCRRAWSRLIMFAYRPRFFSCGQRVIFDPITSYFSYKSVAVGDFVFIAGGAWMSAAPNSMIEIGSCVMFGPRVSILCGDHEMREIGVPMYFAHKDIDSKSSGVTIKNDVWVGANVTILKGVTIGEGAIIAAGSVVTRSVPSYSIVAGVPARVVKQRFNQEELERHKTMLQDRGFWS